MLTSRPLEYHTAVDQSRVLAKAAVLSLEHLQPDDVADYLRLSTRRDVWEPVLSRLTENPALQDVLTNPLMVILARTVYSDVPNDDPSDLLDTDVYGTRQRIEDHLLRAYVPAVYRLPRRGPKWDAVKAQRWLGRLARDLVRADTPDIVWWGLPSLVPRLMRGAVVGATVGVFTWVLIAATFLDAGAALVTAIAMATGVTAAASIPMGSVGRFTAGS